MKSWREGWQEAQGTSKGAMVDTWDLDDSGFCIPSSVVMRATTNAKKEVFMINVLCASSEDKRWQMMTKCVLLQLPASVHAPSADVLHTKSGQEKATVDHS